MTAPKFGEWQPIETAPKDGTIALLYLSEDIDRSLCVPKDARKYTIGFFAAADPVWGEAGGWCSVESREETWGMGSELTGPMTSTDYLECNPTHWMPLPPCPE
jgi:hypothetical protein